MLAFHATWRSRPAMPGPPAPAGLLHVGRDGRERVAPHPARPVPPPADADRTGFVDIPHSLGRRKLLLKEDVDTIRATNNAIFVDSCWVLLAYVTAGDGIGRRARPAAGGTAQRTCPGRLEAIDQGRRVLAAATASAAARQAACDLIWQGNVELLRHEQRAVVQPNFDRLSCAFARRITIGSATSFEARGVRRAGGVPHLVRPRLAQPGDPARLREPAWPRITRFDDRGRWLVTSVVPPLPADRCRHVPDQRQPAAHLRRGAPPRVGPLRPARHRRKPCGVS